MLGLSGLITKFQKRLEIDRKNTIKRVSIFIFLVICSVSAIAVSPLFFSHSANFKEEIPILPGSYTQVVKICGDVLVDKDKFIEIKRNNQTLTFISLNENTITYMTKVDGLSYYYEQIVPLAAGYSIRSQIIQEGFVIREIGVDKVLVILIFIIFPSIELFVCLIVVVKV